MLSMTGFGAATAKDAEGDVSVQIAAVNSRSCQITLRCEIRDLALEEAIRRQVRESLVRGSITVHVGWQSGQALLLDTERLLGAWREMAALAQRLGAPTPALEQVASLQSFTRAHGGRGVERTALAALDQALLAVQAARRAEGGALLAAFTGHATQLRGLLGEMRAVAAGRAGRHREALEQRLREVLGAHPVPDEVLVRELALYADRVDVAEELVRLAAHLDALDALLAGPDDGLGRKLDFLLQEVGREINTTGSKSNDAALTRVVLEAKGALEQMKEQAANVA
jgi:uncharacterized protein (TIGR00255 family)